MKTGFRGRVSGGTVLCAEQYITLRYHIAQYRRGGGRGHLFLLCGAGPSVLVGPEAWPRGGKSSGGCEKMRKSRAHAASAATPSWEEPMAVPMGRRKCRYSHMGGSCRSTKRPPERGTPSVKCLDHPTSRGGSGGTATLRAAVQTPISKHNEGSAQSWARRHSIV